MNTQELTNRIEEILIESKNIFNKYFFDEHNFTLDLVDIFATTPNDFTDLNTCLGILGKCIYTKETGSIYQTNPPLVTSHGNLTFIKTRIPDSTKPFLGAPDFIVKNYSQFKTSILSQKFFTLIERPDYEMIELRDDTQKILIYFVNSSIANLYQ